MKTKRLSESDLGLIVEEIPKTSEINIETWHEHALDRSAWKNVIENLKMN